MPRIQNIIATKRDGGALSANEIGFFVDAYTRGDLPDYQAAALLMAVYLRGMDDAETALLTTAMADSGRRLDLSALPGPTLDKHSTGGVGDKTSLVVVPILAAAGVFVCKMSGRGLGHTGGTLDKLESIRGFRVDLAPDEMIAQVACIGACLAGQTADLAPADKKIYALRDATTTVGSLPLIVSSILSKKLAGGADAFLFDVKVGNGALMETENEARALARALVDGAARESKRAVALLTDMSQPLGQAIGNALEVREAIQVLTPRTTNQADERLRSLCVTLAAEGIVLAGRAPALDEARAWAEKLLESGAAWDKFRDIVKAQKGDARVLEDPEQWLPRAPLALPALAPRGGFVIGIDAARLGRLVVWLGGGRAAKGDRVDPAVGLVLNRRVGQAVSPGALLGMVHANTQGQAETARTEMIASFAIADQEAGALNLLRGRAASGDGDDRQRNID